MTSLNWSTTLGLSSSTPSSHLTGDKLVLPQSALESLLSAAATAATSRLNDDVSTYNPASWDVPSYNNIPSQLQNQQLPHPLTFQLTNVSNGKSIYAGIREFSGNEGEVVLSTFLRNALGVKDDDDNAVRGEDGQVVNGHTPLQIQITSKTLQKGTYVRLRPLEAGYDEDWKSVLEDYLQRNFTTLTQNTVLTIPAQSNSKKFQFLADKVSPEDAICIVDTDLEVDIEPLDEEQARESLKRLLAKKAGTSGGGKIELEKRVAGTVQRGAFVHYKLLKWDRSKPVFIEVDDVEDGDEVDILVATNRPCREPSMEEWVWGNLDSKYPKNLTLPSDELQGTGIDELLVTIYGYKPQDDETDHTAPFSLFVTQTDPDAGEDVMPAESANPDNDICSNCKQSIPKRTMFLHQNFCFRNNILCPKGCGQVFKKGTEHNHWHCSLCSAYGTNPSSSGTSSNNNNGSINTHDKHINISHTPRTCSYCSHSTGSLPELAAHKTYDCPGKLHLCRFCHLILPQEAANDSSLSTSSFVTSLTPHETQCGSRTTNCHMCNRIVQLKNLDIHLTHHDLERKTKPLPQVCRNSQCARIAAGGSSSTDNTKNPLDLCNICFGPLYVATHDPDHTQLARRVERKYLTQLLTGCGKKWCRNDMCKTGRANMELDVMGAKEAMGVIKPMCTVEVLLSGYTGMPLNFCVDETTEKRKRIAERLSMMEDAEGKGGWAVEWCVKAIGEASGDEEKARGWLEKWAVKRNE